MLKQAALNGLLLCFLTNPVIAQEQQSSDKKSSANSNDKSQLCDLARKQSGECKAEKEVESKHDGIEHITVHGRFIGITVPEVEGRYTLDRNFIEALPTSSGDISEMLANLPGVQLGSEFYDIENQAEIAAARVSISGGDAWQTGFFLDGVNFNSRQDPSSYNRSSSDPNDIAGSAQSFNVNKQIVESIEVFTNNVPANYGGFSGGVVEVETRDFNFAKPEFGFNYRTSKSDWNNYLIIESEYLEEGIDPSFIEPVFEKEVVNFNASLPLSKNHGVFFALSQTTSDISEFVIDETVLTKRASSNWLLKLTQKDLWVDKAVLTVNYSPYTSNDVLSDAKNSEFKAEGGGFSSSLLVEQDLGTIGLSSKVSLSQSDNSRRSPAHHYTWAIAKGKDWGNGNPAIPNQVSREGGYGDLDKQQHNLSWNLDAEWSTFYTGEAEHNLSAGIQWQREKLTRERFYDSYIYNSPVTGIVNLDCSGHTIDCLELGTKLSLEELEVQLGEPIDFSNPEHVQAYSDNVSVSPQAFRRRIVYPKEKIEVAVQNVSMYVIDQFQWRDLSLNLGLRYDYEDFLKHHNIAPRISGGYNVLGDSDYLINFGFNRYYDSNLLTYKVRELQLPLYKQDRAIANSTAQNWRAVSGSPPYRYIFREVDTPYNDEFVLGWKHNTSFGSYNIEYVKRWREKQLTTTSNNKYYDPTDGIEYRFAANNKHGGNERISLSWSWQYLNNSFWANTTYQLSEHLRIDDLNQVDSSDIENFIFLKTGNSSDGFDYEEVHMDALETAEAEFSQPLIVNLGWSASFFEQITTTFTLNIQQSYSDFVRTGESRRSEQLINSCSECEEEDYYLSVFEQVKLPDRVLANASVSWKPEFAQLQGVALRFDIQNLFNARTHSVTPGSFGIETGRAFWLQASYKW